MHHADEHAMTVISYRNHTINISRDAGYSAEIVCPYGLPLAVILRSTLNDGEHAVLAKAEFEIDRRIAASEDVLREVQELNPH